MPEQRHLRAWQALVIFLLAVCLFGGLGSIGLVGPDETRYAAVARAMAQTGDWITPRLYGRPWFEKPILYYWSAGASFLCFGLKDWAARLPAAFAALLGALLLAWVARRLYGANEALLALLLFPTSAGLFGFAHAASMDMLLAVALEAAMIATLVALPGLWPERTPELAPALAPEIKNAQAPRRGAHRWPLALVGVCIGLGTLAKGPVAIVLAGGSVLLWAALTRRWRDAWRFLRPEAIAAFAVVAVPWYVACSLANPGFARAFLWFQNVQRFLTPVFEHVRPWWFFGPVLALGLVPWTLALLATARDGWRVFRSGGAARAPGVFVACWAAFPFLFFSLSQSKLPGYILPALPPLVLLLARSVARVDAAGAAKTTDRLGRAAVALVGLTWILLAATAGQWFRRLPPTWDLSHRSMIFAFLFATILVGTVVGVLALAGWARAAVVGSAFWMGILAATVSWLFLPELSPYLSARNAARAAQPLARQNAAIETYQLPRDWQYGLNYYLGRELPAWAPGGAQPVWVYTTQRGLDEIVGLGDRPDLTVALRNGLLLARIEPPPSGRR